MTHKERVRQVSHSEEILDLLDDGRIRVFKNPCNEIFVEDVRTGTTIRISNYPYGSGGLQFTTDHLVEPIRVTNMIGWRVGPR